MNTAKEIKYEDIWNDEKREKIKNAILEHKTYYLFLDDFRHPYDCISYMTEKYLYSKLKWTIVRNYDEFVNEILKSGLPSLISFDHDLADEHYAPVERYDDYDEFAKGFTEKTGHDCAIWLVNYCKENNLELPGYSVHSMNRTGSKNIIKCLEDGKIP